MLILMSLFYNCDVATLNFRCHDIDNVATLGNFWNRCHDIVVDVATLRRNLFISTRKFLLVYPILFLQFQCMLVTISLSTLKNLNSSTNNNTQIFNLVNSAYIHCIAEIITQLCNKGTMKLLCCSPFFSGGPKYLYKFIALLPKDYCLIPSNNAMKLVCCVSYLLY